VTAPNQLIISLLKYFFLIKGKVEVVFEVEIEVENTKFKTVPYILSFAH